MEAKVELLEKELLQLRTTIEYMQLVINQMQVHIYAMQANTAKLFEDTKQKEVTVQAAEPLVDLLSTPYISKRETNYKEVLLTPKKKTSATTSTTSDYEDKKQTFIKYLKYLCSVKEISPSIKTVSQQYINKAIILKGANPKTVRGLYDQGLIQCIYPSPAVEELVYLPLQIVKAARTFLGITRAKQIYIRFYSTMPEFVNGEVLKAEHIIKIGLTTTPIFGASEIQDFTDNLFEEIMTDRRAVAFKVMYAELRNNYKENLWVYDSPDDNKVLIYSIAKNKQPEDKSHIIKSWYEILRKGKMDMSDETAQKYCHLMRFEEEHICTYCTKEELPTDFEENQIYL
jgi:hypothetical protein